MKKIITIIGGIIALLGVLVGVIFHTLGLWQLKVDTILYFLSPFGRISNNANTNIIQIQSSEIIIIATVLLIASITVILGGFLNKNLITLIGSILLVLGVGSFCIAIGNIPEIQELLIMIGSRQNYLFGTSYVNSPSTYTITWRLGNGLFIIVGGTILSLIGSLLKFRK